MQRKEGQTCVITVLKSQSGDGLAEAQQQFSPASDTSVSRTQGTYQWHATSMKHNEAPSSREVSPFTKSQTSPAGAMRHGADEGRASAESSTRTDHGTKMEMLPPEGLKYGSILTIGSCVALWTQAFCSTEACYTVYFSKWKRAFVCFVIIVLGAGICRTAHDVYPPRAKPGAWRPAEQWLQALHFFSLVYIIDAVIMTVGLTPANLNPV